MGVKANDPILVPQVQVGGCILRPLAPGAKISHARRKNTMTPAFCLYYMQSSIRGFNSFVVSITTPVAEKEQQSRNRKPRHICMIEWRSCDMKKIKSSNPVIHAVWQQSSPQSSPVIIGMIHFRA